VRSQRIRAEARALWGREAQQVYNDAFGPRSPLNNKLQHVVFDHFRPIISRGEIGDGAEEHRARFVWQGLRRFVEITEETRENTLELAQKTRAYVERSKRKFFGSGYEKMQSNGVFWLEEPRGQRNRLQSPQVRGDSAWCVARIFVYIYVQLKAVMSRTFVAARECLRRKNGVTLEAEAEEQVEEEQDQDTKTHIWKRFCMCWLQATRHPARNVYCIATKRRSAHIRGVLGV